MYCHRVSFTYTDTLTRGRGVGDRVYTNSWAGHILSVTLNLPIHVHVPMDDVIMMSLGLYLMYGWD